MVKAATLKFFLILFILPFLGCKDNTTFNNFTIKMDVIIAKNDSIHTYYTADGSINFTEEQSFWTKVKGSKKNQQIVVSFPKNIIPSQFRLDFGRALIQEDIVLNKMELSLKDKKLVLKGREIYRFLRVDVNNTILDKNLGLLIRKDKSNKNGPSLYPNGDLLKLKLEKFTKNNN